MNDDPRARSAFLAAARRIHGEVADASVSAVDDPTLTVPGFQAYEAQAHGPVRGYAREGEAHLARTLSFGPLLDALHFRDAARWPSAEPLVKRLVWLFGPPYVPMAQLSHGEYGADDDFDLTPQLDRYADGTTVLMFALVDPGGEGVSASVFQVRIHHSPDRGHRIVTAQLAPTPAG